MDKEIQYILSIDSAVSGCSACLFNVEHPDKSVVRKIAINRGQAEVLIPLVQSVVDQSGVDFQDIDLIATTTGPGTFTGLRVGLSAAKSFAMSLSLPIIGITTLEAIAHDFFQKTEPLQQPLVVLLETGREDFYCQIWDEKKNVVLEACALKAQDILKHIAKTKAVCIGNALERFQDEAGAQDHVGYIDGYTLPDPYIIAAMALEKYDGKHGSLEMIKPLYLRDADVSMPKKPLRKLRN